MTPSQPLSTLLYAITAILFIMISANSMAEQSTLRLAGPPWSPFLEASAPEKGLSTEIVVKALAKAGYTTTVSIKPWRRVMAEAMNNDVDVMIGLWFNTDRTKHFTYSNPYYENRIHLVALTENNFEYESLSALGKLKVGVRQGASFGKEFDNATTLNKVAAPSAMSVLQMLVRNRLDLGVGDRLILENLIKADPVLKNKLSFIEPQIAILPLHMAVVKTHPQHAEIVKKFNSALESMKESGELDNIYKTYHIN